MSAIAILVLLAALSATGFIALFSRARPLFLIGSIVAAGVLAWQAASSFRGMRHCEHLQSSRQVHDFDLTGDGDKTMRIRLLPGTSGLQAWLDLRPGRSMQPRSWDVCRWRARDSAGPVGIELQATRDRLFDLDWIDGFGEGDRTWVDVTYGVDDTTRPILGELQILSLPSNNELMWSDYALLQFRIMAGFFALSALAAAAGVVAQFVRRLRTRRQSAEPPGLVPP